MRLRILLTSLLATTLIWAEDAPKPSTKKQRMPDLPHVWVSEGLSYLKARENCLSFANQPQDILESNFTTTPSIEPHFRWAPGIQVDLGYQPNDQYYFASWSYIQNTAHGRVSTDATEGFFPILSMDRSLTASSYVTIGTVHWKLNTQLGDVGTIFPWKPTSYFLLKIPVGLRIACLNQKLKAYYGGGVFSKGTDVITMRNNFLGAGPRVGIGPNFFLPAGFSLCGEFAAFGLLGRLYVKQGENYLAEKVYSKTRVMTRGRFGLDAKAYLAWQQEIVYKAIIISGQLGWQWREFFDQNRFEQNAFHLSNDNDNLFFQGGFLSLCVAF